MSTECSDADNVLHAISVRQPWAQCVAIGRKDVENRATRSHRKDGTPIPPTTHRGLVAIHASKTPSIPGDTDRRVIRLWGTDPRCCMPTGKIISVATLTDVHYDSGQCCSEWADRGVWHLVLANAFMLDRQVPVNGSPAIPWVVPADVAELVWAQLPIGAGR